MKVPIRQYYNLLSTYLRSQWRWVAILAVLILVTIGLRLAIPQIIRVIIDTAAERGELSILIRYALLFFGIAILTQGLSVAATYVGETVAWTATNALRLDLLDHALHLDATFHKDHSPGQMIERIDGDVATLSNFFSRFTIDVVGNGILVAGILALLFREDWRIGLPILGFAVATLILLVWIRKLAVPYWTKYRKLSAEFFGFLGEHISGREDIRANGAVSHVMRRFLEFVQKMFPVRLRSSLGGYAMWMANVGLFAFGHAVAFGVGASLWRASLITIGTVYLVFHYTELLRGPISEIRTQITDLQRAEAGIRRIRTLLDTESKLDDEGMLHLPSGPLGVSFDGVSFAYESARTPQDAKEVLPEMIPALHDIDFALKPGAVLGLLGRTGSGKTTLARLLVRLYDPQEGSVRVGEHSVDSFQIADLRHAVRKVPQEVQLFRATIRDNVRLFDPSVSDARVLDALEQLGIREWVLRLPDGIDTMLAAEGGGLSAGQGQLIALGRAFLADPGLVILDEASSRLDPETEALLEIAVDRLLENRTAIIIAHRLSTVERADQIMILDEGRLAEYGCRHDLAADPTSRLSRLLQAGMEEVLV
ncbi:ABC transporter ATP-binding protein [Candidatus Bipolaricaulota bacterium]